MFLQLGRGSGKAIIVPKIRHGSLQGFRIPTALHFRGFAKGSNLRPPPTLSVDLLAYFDFPQSGVPVELFFLPIHALLGVVLLSLFLLLTAGPTV
jgi:hypothetical protein